MSSAMLVARSPSRAEGFRRRIPLGRHEKAPALVLPDGQALARHLHENRRPDRDTEEGAGPGDGLAARAATAICLMFMFVAR